MKKVISLLRSFKLWISIVAIFLLALLITYLILPPKIMVEVVEVERSIFKEFVATDGVLRSKQIYIVPAFSDGDIKRPVVKVGDKLKKGDLITELLWDVNYVPVRAPISGVVSKIFRESAGPIRRGEPVIELIDPDQLEVVAELLTTDAEKIKTGQVAQVMTSGEGPAMVAVVDRVSLAGFTKQSALGVEEEKTEVFLALEKTTVNTVTQANLGHNFHVELSIEIASFPDVLVLPLGTIFRDGSHWAVYKVENGKALNVRVEVLGRNGQQIMIKEGNLAAGDLVVNYPGDLIKNGSRVSF